MLNKRPWRASLLLIIYFMGNCILLNNFIVGMAAKSPFVWLQYYYQRQWTKVEPHSDWCSDQPLSTKVRLVRFDLADWTVPGNNQRVSNAVFQRSPIIIVVGLRWRKTLSLYKTLNFCLPPEGQEGLNLGAVVVLVLLGIISFFFHWPCLQTS